MISHVCVGITSFERAFVFYSAVMDSPLGHVLRFSGNRRRAGPLGKPEDADRPLFIIGAPFDGGAAAPGNGQMIALLAPGRKAVADCHAAAMAQGGICEGARPV